MENIKTKQCSLCKQCLPINDFYIRPLGKIESSCRKCNAARMKSIRQNRNLNGLCVVCQVPSKTLRCKECQDLHVLQTKKRRQSKKRRAIDMFGSECSICGLKTNIIEVYELHHLKEKLTGLSTLRSYSLETYLKELEGCILVCHNCHSLIHFYEDIHLSRKKKSERGRNRRRERKMKAMDLLGGKCAHCGLSLPIPELYSFHHRDPNGKEGSPARFFSIKPWDVIEKEISKCDLLCNNCHRIVHYEQNNKEINNDNNS